MKLECRGVRRSFGTFEALKGIDYTAPEGARCIAVLGPSGGGKSTLLRLCAGLDVPDAGQIAVAGTDLPREESALRGYRRTVGTVFQAFNLFPHLSALENIVIPLMHVHRVPPSEAAERAAATLARFGLEEHAHKRPAALSGGQRQRVAIARTVATHARLLFFDEPTSALDPVMTAEVLALIEELKSDGTALFVVSHEIGFARKVADEVLFLSDGRLVEHGPPQQVIDAPSTAECRAFLEKVLRY